VQIFYHWPDSGAGCLRLAAVPVVCGCLRLSAGLVSICASHIFAAVSLNEQGCFLPPTSSRPASGDSHAPDLRVAGWGCDRRVDFHADLK